METLSHPAPRSHGFDGSGRFLRVHAPSDHREGCCARGWAHVAHRLVPVVAIGILTSIPQMRERDLRVTLREKMFGPDAADLIVDVDAGRGVEPWHIAVVQHILLPNVVLGTRAMMKSLEPFRSIREQTALREPPAHYRIDPLASASAPGSCQHLRRDRVDRDGTKPRKYASERRQIGRKAAETEGFESRPERFASFYLNPLRLEFRVFSQFLRLQNRLGSTVDPRRSIPFVGTMWARTHRPPAPGGGEQTRSQPERYRAPIGARSVVAVARSNGLAVQRRMSRSARSRSSSD